MKKRILLTSVISLLLIIMCISVSAKDTETPEKEVYPSDFEYKLTLHELPDEYELKFDENGKEYALDVKTGEQLIVAVRSDGSEMPISEYVEELNASREELSKENLVFLKEFCEKTKQSESDVRKTLESEKYFIAEHR